jgi:hypothetical protein
MVVKSTAGSRSEAIVSGRSAVSQLLVRIVHSSAFDRTTLTLALDSTHFSFDAIIYTIVKRGGSIINRAEYG